MINRTNWPVGPRLFINEPCPSFWWRFIVVVVVFVVVVVVRSRDQPVDTSQDLEKHELCVTPPSISFSLLLNNDYRFLSFFGRQLLIEILISRMLSAHCSKKRMK